MLRLTEEQKKDIEFIKKSEKFKAIYLLPTISDNIYRLIKKGYSSSFVEHAINEKCGVTLAKGAVYAWLRRQNKKSNTTNKGCGKNTGEPKADDSLNKKTTEIKKISNFEKKYGK